tara:strand:+ start:217 stop:438 length:222 start_codon:yes stop_codon:yes gene_type:complete
MEIKRIFENTLSYQMLTVNEVIDIVWGSGNMKGIPQWEDRSNLHKLSNKLKEEILLTKKDFQFLETLLFKYKF